MARGANPPVPLHLRNAPTRLMQDVGYGKGYVYAPDTGAGIAAMSCLPEELASRTFYHPGGRGPEAELADRMERIARWQARRRGRTPDAAPPGGDIDPEHHGGHE